jgi:hypothetical protein
MKEEKIAKWSKDLRLLRFEITDLRTFRLHRDILFWAIDQHRGLKDEDGGVIVQ